MFAYRHDILKTLIDDGVKLVVLGPDEKISDLPGVPDFPARRRSTRPDSSSIARRPSRSLSGRKTFCATPTSRGVGPNQVVRIFARAAD